MGQQQQQAALMIGLDWGTTSLRAYRVAADGRVLDRREAARGILAVEGGRFADALEEVAGDWLAAGPGVPVLASGMIGSRQGWREVPYGTCPAGAEELARGLAEVAGPGGRPVRIVPGLTTRDAHGVPDVMRGEETQILGELAARGLPSGRFVLPGTHSKWATAEAGRILSFATYMTGEVFDVLRRHSILGRLMRDDGAPHDPDAFRRGLDRARAPEPGGTTAAGGGRLLHDLFGARTLGLTGDLPEAALASYLSGLLIGAEIAAASGAEVGEPVTVIGSGALTALYLDALGHLGVPSMAGTPDSAALGLLVLARAAGLLEVDHA
jgi:2-dehydro-3-deoxygalactonokinase